MLNEMRNMDWESRDDARILARANEIRKDKHRFARAVKAAKEMVHDREAELRAIRRIANIDTSNSGKTSNSQLFKESIDILRR